MFIVNSYQFGGVAPPASLLLDTYPATAAYSLRKLRSAYTGDAIRVRRSSDNTEQDIGFVGNDLDTASLLTFVGANNGFVTTWYDQQGSKNLTQGTSSAQPQIVASGVTNVMNTKPTLVLNGTSHFMQSSSFTTIPQPTTKITVNSFNDITNLNYVLDGSSGLRQIFGTGSATGTPPVTGYRIFAGTIDDYSTLPSASVQYFNMVLYNGASSNLTVNNSLFVNKNIGTNGLNQITLGRSAFAASQYLNGNCQEVIIYGSDESANRVAIRTNINDYYAIY